MTARLPCWLATVCVVLTGCYREVHVIKQMSWACEPKWDRTDYPGVQSVRFFYEEAPNRSELLPGRHLCDKLKASGRPVVNMEFVVFGNPWDGAQGYRIERIDNKSYAPAGGWASSRIEGQENAESATDPFRGLIPKHRLF